MISELMAMLDRLQGEVFFFVEDGPLKHRLIERYLDEEESQSDILDFELDAALRIQRKEGTAIAKIEGRLEAGDFLYQTNFAIQDFAADEITELLEYWKSLCPTPSKPKARPDRNILRKKNGSGMLGISAAAKALGLSQRALKVLIPCSEIRVEEQDGEKVIEEYYWEKDLLGRFTSVGAAHKEGRDANREDVTCITEWCCDGDRQWARDLINEFLKQRHLTAD
ncbi:MAG: hypothetical protein K8R55_00280 [Desulfuromonadaceae bacterium]|nr:hypothetical protein [Desulfuromonadaceae bacterium]